uniref:Uncharacterized protein n=1 Tax=Branchiostoma floridae TaxID=7739 RepID=C3Y3W3_BRAFL|eukprot:XP_002608979.1 hypothetical protein BRAFLDRAFT_104964 [Branchiostoma floridae]
MGCNCSSLQGSGNCPHFPDQQNGTWLPVDDKDSTVNSRSQWGLSSSQTSTFQVQNGTQLISLTSLIKGGYKNGNSVITPEEHVSIKDILGSKNDDTSSRPDDQQQYQHLKSLLRGTGQPINNPQSCNIHLKEECSTESDTCGSDSETIIEKDLLGKRQDEDLQKTTLENNLNTSATWDGIEYVTNDHFFSGISNDLWPGETVPQAAQCCMNGLASPVTVHSDESMSLSSPRSDVTGNSWHVSQTESSLEEQSMWNTSLDGLLRKVVSLDQAELSGIQDPE